MTRWLPPILGFLSLICLFLWGNFTLFYSDAAPIVVVGVILGVIGLCVAGPSIRCGASTIRIVGFVISLLGLLGNLGLFIVAVLDM